MNDAPFLHYVVPQEQDGWRLKSILRSGMNLSRKLLTTLRKHEGTVRVDDVPLPLYVTVSAYARITVALPEEPSSTIPMRPMTLDIIHEDEHLLVLNKPAGIVVHPTKGHYDDTLASGVLYHWSQRGETIRFRPIHRLDHDTSGVLLIAKNRFAHAAIASQFERGTVRKTYVAIVQGVLAVPHGWIELPIDRIAPDQHRRIVTPLGAYAKTSFVRMECHATTSFVRLHPHTGRTHQLRVHLAAIGHPILGDQVYGETAHETEGTMKRQALHAQSITFDDVVTKTPRTFWAPLPVDIAHSLCHLRQSSPAFAFDPSLPSRFESE